MHQNKNSFALIFHELKEDFIKVQTSFELHKKEWLRKKTEKITLFREYYAAYFLLLIIIVLLECA